MNENVLTATDKSANGCAHDRAALEAQALDYHLRGFNCAQCVACTLAPLVDADLDFCFRATEGFGAGMGGMSETCGAVSGGVVALGMLNSAGSDAPSRKASTYKLVRRLVDAFRAQNGSTVCRELKGVGTGAPLRSCNDCICDAVRMTLDVMGEARG